MSWSLSPRSALVLIAALFIVPLLAAWMMYSGIIDFRPAETRNLGQLVEPPIPVEWSSVQLVANPEEPAEKLFLEHWVVVHPITLPCTNDCVTALEDLRQVHKASGRHQDRIRLGILAPATIAPEQRKAVEAIYPNFMVIIEQQAGMKPALTRAGAGGSNYLIDPLGNIMMRYEAGADPNHLKQDLKRLLTWSKLDEQ